jgi:hypothetical protein
MIKKRIQLLSAVFTGVVLGFGLIYYLILMNQTTANMPKGETKKVIGRNFTPTPTSVDISLPLNNTKESTGSSKKNSFGTGQLCGGIADIPCPPNFYCQKEDSGQESSGFCAKM